MKIQYRKNHFGEDVYSTTDKTANNFFDIAQYGTTFENSAYELYHNPHLFHVFEYVVSGKGFIHTTDNQYEVKAGDFYYIRRGFIGHYGADKGDPYKKIWINVDGTMVGDLADMFAIHDPVLIRHIGEEAEALIRSVHAALNSSGGTDSKQILGKCSVDIFALLSLAVGRERLESSEYHMLFSARVKQYINGHIFDNIDLDSIADHFFINRSYLIRKFKRETGITPMRYYNNCRIDAARNLLSFNGMPVKEVASKLNFSDTAYFSNRFKEETGYSPSEYTKELHTAYVKAQNSK